MGPGDGHELLPFHGHSRKLTKNRDVDVVMDIDFQKSRSGLGLSVGPGWSEILKITW